MTRPTARRTRWFILAGLVLLLGIAFAALATSAGFAAYTHDGDSDSANFRIAYPDKVGTKLDSCTLCHTGGSYVSGGKTTTLGSCQWCHYIYGYDAHGNILDTLNQYGMDYLNNGRDVAAVEAIGNIDSDADGHSNAAEIAAVRYPGDPSDTPAKVPAPSIVLTGDQLEQMPQHTQFLLMNASKSTDTYTQYTGVTVEKLLEGLVLDSATGITVFSPDGFSQYHPLTADSNINSYHVKGTYPPAQFYGNEQADIAKNPSTGWVDYSAPSVADRKNGDPIVNPDGLKMLLAFKRDGQYLAPGVLNPQNKLDGEGPFRLVPPQKNPGPPDQRSTAVNATDPGAWIWPYLPNGDHNAGFSSRTVTIIRVDPLPAGTTDINLLEAGWPYVDEDKIVIYGAINPVPTIQKSLDTLITTIRATDDAAFKSRGTKTALAAEVGVAKTLVNIGARIEATLNTPSNNPKVDTKKHELARAAYSKAFYILNGSVLGRTDGCVLRGSVDKNDWVTDTEVQKQLYWSINETTALLNIIK